jgi:hypothetical protein
MIGGMEFDVLSISAESLQQVRSTLDDSWPTWKIVTDLIHNLF